MLWVRTVRLAQAESYVDMEVIPPDVGSIRVPVEWTLSVSACLTANLSQAVPPSAVPTGGELSVAVRMPGAYHLAPAGFTAGSTLDLTSLPRMVVGRMIPSTLRFSVAGLDADKTLLITLAGESA